MTERPTTTDAPSPLADRRVRFAMLVIVTYAVGFGITRDIGDDLLDWGVNVMTSGNHIWDKKEAIDYIGTEARLLRPANYPPGVPGRGTYVSKTKGGASVGVINAMGRVFMLQIDDRDCGPRLGGGCRRRFRRD